MITYYKDTEVLVTSEFVGVGGRRLRLGELRRVWHVRGRRSWGKVFGRGALGLAILVPALVGALAVGVALLMDAPMSTTILVGGGGLLIGFLGFPLADLLLELMDRSHDRGSRRREIWALVGGREVLLLATADAQRFGRIYRALQRALEQDQPGRTR